MGAKKTFISSSIVLLTLAVLSLAGCGRTMSDRGNPGSSAVTPARATTAPAAPVLGTAAAGAAAGAASGMPNTTNGAAKPVGDK